MWESIVSACIAILVPLLTKLIPMWIDSYVSDLDQKKKLRDAFDSFLKQYNDAKKQSVDMRKTYESQLEELSKEGQSNGSTTDSQGKTT